jgi:uncharacterized protein (TIGR03086 family)
MVARPATMTAGALYVRAMSDNLRNFTKAVYGMDHVVRSVPSDQWSSPSPCTEWCAADVLNHAAGVLGMVEGMASGSPPAAATGAGAAENWAARRDSCLASLDHQGVLHKVVKSPFGEMPVDNLIGILFVDTLTHTWDLARAVGGDEKLDAELVQLGYAQMLPLDTLLRGTGRFADKIEPNEGDDAQTRFLKFLGRDAS